jgi:alkanesulfonate monooxygenase SsuD/methylene tetrahydromethanopterin reductase-like flavin-dependent oxidoreductase (luciferase family)
MREEIKIPESMMSGGNPNTVELVKKFGMHLGTGYDIFINNYDSYRKYEFPKIFVQVSLLIRDTDEEALATKAERVVENINIIAGSKETVEKKILELYSMGATDLFVSNAFGERGEERQRIHELVKSMKCRGLAI